MWKTTTLGETCKMYQPQTIATKHLQHDGAYPVYGANGVIGRHDKYNHKQSQLLVTCRGATCGSVNVSVPNSWINGNAMVVQPDESNVSLRYMEYLFRGGIDLRKAITGAAQPQITRKSLNPIKFSYPPLAEQKRITAKLDSAFAEIDKAIVAIERKKAEVVNLKRAVLAGEFSESSEGALMWQAVKLDEVCQFQSGLWKGKKAPFVKAHVLRNTNFTTSGKLSYRNVAELDVEKKQLESRVLEFGDIILEKSGGGENQPVGRVCVFEKTGGDLPCTLSNFTSFIRVKNKSVLDYRFLHKVLYFMHAAGKTEPMQRFSTAIRNLQLTQYKNIVLFVPPLAEQNRIVKKLDAIFTNADKVADIATKQLANYQALKSAILKQELQGETK